MLWLFETCAAAFGTHPAQICLGEAFIDSRTLKLRSGNCHTWDSWIEQQQQRDVVWPTPVAHGFNERCCATSRSCAESRGSCGGRPELYSRTAGPTWNLSSTLVTAVDQLSHPEALDFVRNNTSHRLGWVPHLEVQAVHNGLKQPLPCSTSRGEDAALARTFFTHWQTGSALPGVRASGAPATFLEIGGANGMTESCTWVFERCLGWRGILVEGHPKNFAELTSHRPGTLNLQMAVCPQEGWVNFTAYSGTWTKIEESGSRLQVQCGPLGTRLQQLGVLVIDLFVLDVEGSELLVLESLALRRNRISVGVFCIEVNSR